MGIKRVLPSLSSTERVSGVILTSIAVGISNLTAETFIPFYHKIALVLSHIALIAEKAE